MTRAQKIISNLSFESDSFDIYNPKFSSDQEALTDLDQDGEIEDEDERMFASEEAKGKICDERLSEMNPCIDDESSAEDDTSDNNDSVDSNSSSTTSQPNIRPDLLSQALSATGARDRTLSNNSA